MNSAIHNAMTKSKHTGVLQSHKTCASLSSPATITLRNRLTGGADLITQPALYGYWRNTSLADCYLFMKRYSRVLAAGVAVGRETGRLALKITCTKRTTLLFKSSILLCATMKQQSDRIDTISTCCLFSVHATENPTSPATTESTSNQVAKPDHTTAAVSLLLPLNAFLMIKWIHTTLN